MSASGTSATYTEKDDLFHPSESADPALTETVWWNFYVPEKNLDAEIYLCFRRNLKVAYAGILVWDAYCRHFNDARYFDVRSYLPLPASDLNDCRLDNGLRMRAVRPLERYELSYEGVHDFGFELEFGALAPPIGFSSVSGDTQRASYAPGHFDQVGRMHGALRLDGESIAVDCITQRDRSWGAIRKEDPQYPPDVDWHSAHFGEELWMQCWLWHKEPVANELQGGVVYRRGRAVRLVRAERRTHHSESGIEARTIELSLTDEEGGEYVLEGHVRNMFPWPGWFNMQGFAGLVQWQWQGRTGWGEVHDGRTVSGVIAQRRRRAQSSKGDAC